MTDLLTRLEMGTQVPQFDLRLEAAAEIRRLSRENDRLSQNLLDMANEVIGKIWDGNKSTDHDEQANHDHRRERTKVMPKSRCQIDVLDELIVVTRENIETECSILRQGISDAVRSRGDLLMLRKVHEATNLLLSLVDATDHDEQVTHEIH